MAGLQQSTTASLWPRVANAGDGILYLNINPDDAYIGINFRAAVGDETFPAFRVVLFDMSLLYSAISE